LKFEGYIHELLNRRVFPGITILAGSHRGEVFTGSYGNRCVEPEVIPLKPGSIYDTASLTKPFITALLILILEDHGALHTHDPLNKFIKGFPEGIRISHLLTHSSGVQGWYPLYLENEHPVDVIRTLPVAAKPGRKVIYSCLGYILLSEVIRKVTERKFSDTADAEIIGKLGLKDTFLTVPVERVNECVPTETGNRYEREMAFRDHPGKAETFPWRTELITGEVNDGNAHFLKGESGNAGLFSTAEDMFELSRQFYPELTSLLKPATAALFWKNQTPCKRSHRSFGFKLNSSLITSGGWSLSRNAIGHNGFTGTSIWMEPDTSNVYILLTNRIHPRVDSDVNFNRIRRKLHKLIRKDLGLN